jgi:hypothetical protein
VAFTPGATPKDPGVEVGRLTKQEVEELCPRRAEVQRLVNEAVATLKRETYLSESSYGTAIHKYVERKINALGDPNFRAEISLLASDRVHYATKDSKRLDVFENPGTGTVCIHDEKTGKAKLSFSAMTKLVAAAHSFYPGTQRVIVTEVRPGE